MSEDGGLAESLNIYLDTAEQAPALMPEDATEKLGLPADLQAERIFIHKTANYENYIVESDGSVFAYVQGKKLPVMELNSETINNISSVGNTLVIATNKRLVYALYRDSSYVYLGDGIPRPDIEFRTVSNLNPDTITQEFLLQHATGMYSPINALEVDAWNKAIEDLDANKTNENTVVLDALNKKIWGDINKKISDIKKERKFATPFFVRYAVRLYDLSYYHISEPILIGAGYDNLFDISATRTRTTNNGISTYITWRLSNIFTSIAHLKKWDTVGWEDIVNSIDIFFSTPLYFPNNEAKFSKLIMTSGGGTGQLVNNDYYDIKFKMSKNTEFESIEDEILSKSVFFKYASFTLAEIEELAKGYDLGVHNGVLLEEVLESQDKLSESIFAKNVIASKLATFNNRLIINVLSQDYSEGFNELPSTNVALGAPGRSTRDGRFFAFYLSDGTKIIARNSRGNADFYPYQVDVPGELGDETKTAAMFGLLFFPETSCKKVVICDEEGLARTVEMKAHPNLPYSYAFWGLSKTDLDLPYEEINLSDFLSDQMAVKQTNKLLISESSNPFNFPLTGVFEFQSKVLGVAIATTALSQGQFGQFPLYVFTEDGIWAMETAANGSFVTNKPLSREVCVNPDSICSIDNAVVFVTAQGVMMLQGSQVVNISPYMNGRHYQIENSARTIIETQDFFCDLLPALSDNTHFLAFVKAASIAYDYAGRRLIFIKKDEKYQYIYKLDTQTWHKTAYGLDLVAPINSYPECLIQGNKDGKSCIYDFSTILDAVESKTSVKGVIVTRPFDLGEPDVFKTITDVRIRGQFPKGAVKFILLGSNDGINFATVSTLRGRSWKLFRMVILANLDPTDRISWIDVMYDTKFTNKLR